MAGTDGLVLQQRDRQLLEALGTMRIVDREQAMAVAGFHSISRANVRLLRLNRAGLLRRLYVGNRAGNRKALYALSAKGAALASARLWRLSRRSIDRLIVDPSIEHQLAVNALRILVCHRPLPERVRLKSWSVFKEPISAGVPLKPDGYFELHNDTNSFPMFLEVDRGTEGQRIWKQKTESYVRLALSGQFAQMFGPDKFRVLVAVSSGRRLESIRAAVARQTPKIFWFATFESINREGFWSAVWLRPTGDRRQSLL
jgi:hypothetical protein